MALVESEKTAVICACLHPNCIWLATGGKGRLNDRVEVLYGCKVIAFLHVRQYIQQERHAEMLALIEDLELEVVGVEV